MTKEFKVGDKVRLVNPENSPEEFRGELTVDDVRGFLPRIGVDAGGDQLGAFFPAELKHVSSEGFAAGDRVEFVEKYSTANKGDQGIVSSILDPEDGPESIVVVHLDKGDVRQCYPSRLKHVPTTETASAAVLDPAFNSETAPVDFDPTPWLKKAVEVAVLAQPVTYRICINNRIGDVEYVTLEEAQEAARVHGENGEQFAIFEVVKIADYRVVVTKDLEII